MRSSLSSKKRSRTTSRRWLGNKRKWKNGSASKSQLEKSWKRCARLVFARVVVATGHFLSWLLQECRELSSTLSAVFDELPATRAETKTFQDETETYRQQLREELHELVLSERMARQAAEQDCKEAEAAREAIATEIKAADGSVESSRLELQQVREKIKGGYIDELADNAIKVKPARQIWSLVGRGN
jgi:chromosome segregation ATPase